MAKFLKPAFFGICLILFVAMYARIGFAVGTYYLDSRKNDRSYTHQSYSQSEVYADVSGSKTSSYSDARVNTYADASKGQTKVISNDKNIQVYNNTTTSTISGGSGKKIYNTIIIKTNKNNKNTKQVVNKGHKKVKVIKTDDIDEHPKTIEKHEVNKKRYSNEHLRPEERARLDEEQIEENKKASRLQYEDIEEEYKSDTKKQKEYKDKSSTPDGWYIYGFAGYSLGVPLWSNLKSVINDVAQPKTDFPFSHGFHFGAGLKIYGWHFFISPEFVYQRFSTTLHSQSAIVDVTYYSGFGTVNRVPLGEKPTVEQQSIVLKDLITGSFRVGFTFGNSFSIYGKANLGMINMQASINYSLPQSSTNGLEPYEVDSINYQIGQMKYDKNNWGFVYGVGAGIEASFWRQHVFFRLEYNYYLMSSYNKVVLPATKAGANNKIMQYKSNFGVALFSVGIAF